MDQDVVRQAVYSGDVEASIAMIEQAQDPLVAMDLFMDAAAKTYWERKNLLGTVRLSSAALEFASKAAPSRELRERVKVITYNLGSFTWPGWDEPGITIDPVSQDEGMRAALMNLELAEELGGDPRSMAGAHWLIGAHHMAARRYAEADASFEAASGFSRQAGASGEELMAMGYRALIDILRGDSESGEAKLQEVIRLLKDTENGPFYGEQLDTALRVLGQSLPA